MKTNKTVQILPVTGKVAICSNKLKKTYSYQNVEFLKFITTISDDEVYTDIIPISTLDIEDGIQLELDFEIIRIIDKHELPEYVKRYKDDYKCTN